MPKTKIEWTQSADGSAGYSWNPIQGTMGKSHRPHTTPGSRTPRQSEIHDMVDSVILAKFGGSFLDGHWAAWTSCQGRELPLRNEQTRRTDNGRIGMWNL